MRAHADPIGGFSLPEVLAQPSGAATNDLYGKLFYHIRSTLSRFYSHIHSRPTAFHFLSMDAAYLSDHLADERFARIEVSNISDCAYLGCQMTLAFMMPLLDAPDVNPHATLIMLFMNAVEEMVQDLSSMVDRTKEVSQCAKFTDLTAMPTSAFDPVSVLMGASLSMFRDADKYFAK